MQSEQNIPTLLEILFGKEAGTVLQMASERTLAWCRAFGAWLQERLRRGGAGTNTNYHYAWRRLLAQCRKMPWELVHADVEQHAAWMQAQGYAAGRIKNEINILSNFYRWCGERGVDPQCGADFNPAAGVLRPRVRPYVGQALLSLGEVQALLGILARDPTPVGRRDHAFFLARLRLGVPLKHIRQLRWGQIETDREGAWVRWRPEAERVKLPEDAWETIRAYLAGTGRLAGMRAESCVFAPLACPVREGTGGRAEDWVEGRCVTQRTLLDSLKLYGRAAGIAEEKLTLRALQRTAARLRLEAGESLEGMQVFLDSREEPSSMKHRLGFLPELPAETERSGESEPEPPDRQAKPFQPGHGFKHGFCAHSLPLEEVRAVMEEHIEGLDEEFIGLRLLDRQLIEWMKQSDGTDKARLGEAYTEIASRMKDVIDAERRVAQRAKETGFNEEEQAFMMQLLCAGRGENGTDLTPEQVWRQVMGGNAEGGIGERELEEEIAGIRYVLRNTFELAMQAQETKVLLRMADVYSQSCYRLLRLLDRKLDRWEKLNEYFVQVVDETLAEILEELRMENGE